MSRRLFEWLWVLGLLCASVLVATPARADGFIIVWPDEPGPHPPIIRPIPRPRPIPHPVHQFFPLSVRYHDVTVTVKDQVAITEVDQVFTNPNPRDLEGTYIFPIPRDAAVSGLSLWMGGKEVEGELLDADKAREIYTSIVRRMQDPALLEYADRGLLKARVFPIPANGEARVKLRYEEVLRRDGGLIELRYPLNTEKFSAKPLERCKVTVTLEGPVASAFSPSHGVRVERTDVRTTCTYEDTNVTPDRDFVLYYRRPETDKAIGVSVAAHRVAGQDGTFLMLLSPDAADSAPAPAKDVLFVIDRSGSMAGEKMEQARRALAYCIRTLEKHDRFQIVDFGTGVAGFGEGLVDASPETVRAALAYVEGLKARGGTDLHGALTRAFAIPGEKGRPYLVVCLTDGEPTIGVTAPDKIEQEVQKAREARVDKEDVRLFVLGVGGDLNAVLLDRLAEQNRGLREYIGERESIEVKVSSFFDKVSAPVLSDVTIAIDGLDAHDIYPRPVPDLFHGAEVAVLGRYRGTGAKAIRVKGKLLGRPVELVYEARFPDLARAPYLERAWAVRKVGFLLDQIRLHGEKAELREEVTRLAKEYGIVTPYTSYLVAEDAEIARGRGRPADAGERAFDHLRRRAQGFARDEAEARDALRGAPGAPPAARPGASGEGAARASESIRKLGEGSVPAAGSPSADAAAPLDLSAQDLLRAGLLERERFAKDARSDGAAEAQADEAAAALSEVVKVVEGRAFYRDGEVWVDARLARDATVEKVAYLSDAYFALLAESPEAGPYLALGARVRFTLGKRSIEVTAP